MKKVRVLVTNATWEVDDDDLNTHGDLENALDALGLPGSFVLEVEDGDDIDDAIRAFARENYRREIGDDYGYRVVGDGDCLDDEDDDEDDEDDWYDDDEDDDDEDDLA